MHWGVFLLEIILHQCKISRIYQELTLSGVPHGSVLGPLVFLLYINDIHKSSSVFNFYLFADDTSMLYANKNLRELENKVNTELGNLWDWLKANKISLKIKKSNFVIFFRVKNHLPFIPRISILDYEMNSHKPFEKKEYLEYVKYLRRWSFLQTPYRTHIGKISKCVGVMAKLRHFVPRQTLLSIF